MKGFERGNSRSRHSITNPSPSARGSRAVAPGAAGSELQSASEGNETRLHREEGTVRARVPDEFGSGVVHGGQAGGRTSWTTWTRRAET